MYTFNSSIWEAVFQSKRIVSNPITYSQKKGKKKKKNYLSCRTKDGSKSGKNISREIMVEPVT